MKHLLFALIYFGIACPTFAEEHSPNHPYTAHPEWSKIFSYWWEDYGSFANNMLSHSPRTYGVLAGSTLALLPVDQKLRDNVVEFSRENGLMKGESQERRVFAFSLFGAHQGIFLPRSLMGLFWYFGDGSSLLFTSGAFAAYGYAAQDYRSTQVSMQILEALTIAGPTVLAIKMATGRESPAESTRSGGKWQGYPGIKAYTSNQAKYYSYPSGHTAAAVAALSVIAENYPEKAWILPVEGTVVGLLMVALMNVGSHWPSDYPLAILIGYTSAKTVVTNHKRRARPDEGASEAGQWNWHGIKPHFDETSWGLKSTWVF